MTPSCTLWYAWSRSFSASEMILSSSDDAGSPEEAAGSGVGSGRLGSGSAGGGLRPARLRLRPGGLLGRRLGPGLGLARAARTAGEGPTGIGSSSSPSPLPACAPPASSVFSRFRATRLAAARSSAAERVDVALHAGRKPHAQPREPLLGVLPLLHQGPQGRRGLLERPFDCSRIRARSRAEISFAGRFSTRRSMAARSRPAARRFSTSSVGSWPVARGGGAGSGSGGAASVFGARLIGGTVGGATTERARARRRGSRGTRRRPRRGRPRRRR